MSGNGETGKRVGQGEMMSLLFGVLLSGKTSNEWLKDVGVDPDELRTAAEEAAEEEFARVEVGNLNPEGRLMHLELSDFDKELVKEALVDTFEVGVILGIAIGRAR